MGRRAPVRDADAPEEGSAATTPVEAGVSTAKSGWCIADQHEFCAWVPCGCTDCPPEVHQSRAWQAPQAGSRWVEGGDIDGGPVGVDEPAVDDGLAQAA